MYPITMVNYGKIQDFFFLAHKVRKLLESNKAFGCEWRTGGEEFSLKTELCI